MLFTTMWSASLRNSTNPPYSERAAEPEARPARSASSAVVRVIPAAADAATTNAANDDADDARPAASGKLLPLDTAARGRSAPRTVSRHAATRGNRSGLSSPLTLSRSKSLSRSTHISVYRSSRVIEIEPTAGRLRAVSRLPQYLTRAMLGWALAVAPMVVKSGVVEGNGTRIIAQDRRGLAA